MTQAWAPVRTPLIIDGADRFVDDTFPVYDPSETGSVVGMASAASARDATDAVSAAQAAWPGWAAHSAADRVKLILDALGSLNDDFDQRTELLVRENGKVRFEASIDLQVFVGRFHQAAALAGILAEPSRIDGPPFDTSIEHVAMGVVTIIIPFNWPLAILAASLPHALIAGNTVVVKPPPTTPLSVVTTLGHLARSLPPGVLNVITGHDAVVGSPLIEDPRVKKVCFTGSVNGGRRIMAMATTNLTNVTLELGGNDPAVILDDAQLDAGAFERMAMGAFMTTGQVCMAIKRLYVPRSRFSEVVDGLRAALSPTRVGPGYSPESTMGPLNMAAQRDYVLELLAEAQAGGAEILHAGSYVDDSIESRGHYLLPALVLDPAAERRIVVEEQFGPALPIIAYDDEADAIAQANDTWSGLCSSVWSGDAAHGASVARQLRAGVTFYNNHNAPAVDERAPFGGFNQSGIGRELGGEGLLAFTETHVVSVATAP
jgi:acyl-CoA reductase-like NAD-dependent aldehyde dehydrogenase